jgi:lipopolysaccharide export LptBFGC system permease protein LptF
MYKVYLALLLFVGLIAAVVGTILPQGGGTTLMVMGVVAIGAFLVLIGLGLRESGNTGRSHTSL